ncbi:hypothetical protein ACFLXQ_06840 [Chloroflexota bacterium]
MLDKKYEELVRYLEGMITDGVQLVHGGHLMSWEDTNILDLLREISRKKEEIKDLTCKSGDLLKNVYSGQKVAVIRDDGKIVYLNSIENVINYPKDKLWYHYEKSKPGDE